MVDIAYSRSSSRRVCYRNSCNFSRIYFRISRHERSVDIESSRLNYEHHSYANIVAIMGAWGKRLGDEESASGRELGKSEADTQSPSPVEWAWSQRRKRKEAGRRMRATWRCRMAGSRGRRDRDVRLG